MVLPFQYIPVFRVLIFRIYTTETPYSNFEMLYELELVDVVVSSCCFGERIIIHWSLTIVFIFMCNVVLKIANDIVVF